MSSIPHNWNDKLVNQYLSLRPPQLSEGNFRQVHQPIDKIFLENILTPVADTEDFVTQVEFLDIITTADLSDRNRMYIIEGEVGSGKSHLSTWLKHEIGDTPTNGQNGRVAITVGPDTQNFDGTIQKLSDMVDVDQQPKAIDKLDPAGLAKEVVANLQVNNLDHVDSFSKEEIDALIEIRENKLDLTDIIEDNIRTYQSKLTSEENPVLELIDRAEYRQLRTIALEESSSEKGFEHLRADIGSSLNENIDVLGVKDRLSSISVAAIEEGFRPVLICPDITPMWVVQNDILEYGIQSQSGHFDIIIGCPNGWFKEKHRGEKEDLYTYIRNKSDGLLQLSDPQGDSYFLSKETAVSLVAGYVDAIQSESNDTLNDTAHVKCFNGLYPFTASFIRRLYTHLTEEDVQGRTPRLLLRAIQECLLALDPPFEAVEELSYIRLPQGPIPMEYPTKATNLTRWYGEIEKNRITIPRGVFETFDVEVPTQMEQDDEIHIIG